MQLFLHIVFWLKEISEASAEGPKNIFRVSIHHKGWFCKFSFSSGLFWEKGKRRCRCSKLSMVFYDYSGWCLVSTLCAVLLAYS